MKFDCDLIIYAKYELSDDLILLIFKMMIFMSYIVKRIKQPFLRDL